MERQDPRNLGGVASTRIDGDGRVRPGGAGRAVHGADGGGLADEVDLMNVLRQRHVDRDGDLDSGGSVCQRRHSHASQQDSTSCSCYCQSF